MVFLFIAFVAIVVGLTYLSQWIPRTPVTPTPKPTGPTHPTVELRKLHFPIESCPDPVDTEVRVEGHRDFLFRNNQDKDVEIGLLRERSMPFVSGDIALLTPEQADAFDKGTPDNLDWKPLKDEATMLPKDQAAVLRLKWKHDEPSPPTRAILSLWCQDPGDERGRKPSNSVEVPIKFTPGMAVMPPLKDGIKLDKELDADDKAVQNFFCLSATRKEFTPKVVVRRRDGKPDPCFTYRVVPLSTEELEQIAEGMKQMTQEKAHYLSGYRVEVTVHETAPDGKTWLDLGSFMRSIEFSSDFDPTPIGGTLSGKVVSDIKVISPEGRVNFAIFNRRDGATTQVVLDSPPSVELRVVGHEPDYLSVQLDKTDDPGRWKLSVTIPPNKARSAPLPRESCVMLECTGDRARQLRVPVSGTATD